MFFSYSLFMADGSHLRRTKLTCEAKHDCRWLADNSGADAREALGLAKCAGKSNRQAKTLQMSKMSPVPASMDKCHGNEKTNIPQVLGIRKLETQKNLEKTKQKNPEVLVDRGVQPRVPKYCFFGFVEFFFLHEAPPRRVSIFFVFSSCSLMFFTRPLPKESPNIFCCFLWFLFFWFSPRGPSQTVSKYYLVLNSKVL